MTGDLQSQLIHFQALYIGPTGKWFVDTGYKVLKQHCCGSHAYERALSVQSLPHCHWLHCGCRCLHHHYRCTPTFSPLLAFFIYLLLSIYKA